MNLQDKFQIIDDLHHKGYSLIRIPDKLFYDCLKLVKSFYNLDLSVRLSCLSCKDSGILGYSPSELEISIIENELNTKLPTFNGLRMRGYSSFDFLEESSIFLGAYSLLKKNLWVKKNTKFKREALLNYQKLKKFGKDLSSDITSSLSIFYKELDKKFLNNFNSDCLSLMRLLEYKPGEKIGISKEHTDYEYLTIIITNCSGLEIKKNGIWETVPFKKQHAIILPGDMMEVYTKGKIESTLHRVRCGTFKRYSVIFFQGLPLNTKINYSKGKIVYPTNYRKHIFSMLLKSSAHLIDNSKNIAHNLDLKIPPKNPFRIGK